MKTLAEQQLAALNAGWSARCERLNEMISDMFTETQLSNLCRRIERGETLTGLTVLTSRDAAKSRGLSQMTDEHKSPSLPQLMLVWDAQRQHDAVLIRRQTETDGVQFSVWAKRMAAPARTDGKLPGTFAQRLEAAGVFDAFLDFCRNPERQWPHAKAWLDERGIDVTAGALIEWRKKHGVSAQAGFRHAKKRIIPAVMMTERRTA